MHYFLLVAHVLGHAGFMMDNPLGYIAGIGSGLYSMPRAYMHELAGQLRTGGNYYSAACF